MARGRKFTIAQDLLQDLLDRFEDGTAQPVGYPDHGGFADITASDVFMRKIGEAERRGGVALVYGSGRRRGELKLVRLTDARLLYEYLDRTPSRQTALTVGEEVLGGLSIHPAIRDVAFSAVEAWSRNRKWINIGVESAASMRNAVILAQAIVEKRHLDLDYRTFSRRIVADSKALEKLEGAVLRLVGAVVDVPPASSARAAFATLGLERFSPPLLLSGRFLLDGISVGASLSYLGIPPTEMMRISFSRQPDYVLTVENFASFNRHVLEADPNGSGLTLFVGGYPSLAAQKAIAVVASMLPDTVPFFHWSDIDADGTWIFRTIERALERRLRPHLMSRELAEAFGVASIGASKLRRGEAAGSMISNLVDYLAQPEAKIMEQEQVDPQIPNIVAT
ncbi:Wadjet anti-phage system protein JetD domain-containing protein [Neorhizobium galegae]|uniref:Blr1991 protein n=3 Tax=Neorhizobium galegae TaxID=399 RepID=A0A068SW28_NEOGA|nr:Wadjet anti-phage system protein JetD domain-containing protein [Neorhizobium galegae]CDN50069.1 Blr1991 protein [Neorhizobium galegae bv. orientalis str. HAMBI 540]